MGNTLVAMIAGAIAIYAGYNFYARRIDRSVIRPDRRRATPARLYMDGVDFVPTSRSVLYGYHFKSIAAAGPIVGTITAATLWGWLPALLWLIAGVTLMGWASDYSAIVVSVRNEGDSLSAIAHKLIAPRTRRILLVFIFFYLLLVAGAFANIVATALVDPRVPLGIIALAVLGLAAGQMLYRMKLDLILVTLVTVGLTIVAIVLNASMGGPVATAFVHFNAWLNSFAPNGITTVLNPTLPPGQQYAPVTVSFVFWLLFTCAFAYAGATLPIWRYAQPVNYLGFWLMGLTVLLGGLGAFLAFFIRHDLATFRLPAFIGFGGPVSVGASGGIQPLWPMLFVTIACGALSGWHAMVGSVSTARQIENEEDMLPVGGGAMFSEFVLALLALMAVAVAAKPGAATSMFAQGVGSFLNIFAIPPAYGTAIGLVAFAVIVITVVQLVFRLMRITLAEALGERHPIFASVQAGTLMSMAMTFILVVTGTWVYIWQLFGAANQLMASLSLLVVTIWLVSTRRNALFTGLPMLFMFITTMAATVVTGYNLYATVLAKNWGVHGRTIATAGSLITIGIAVVIFAAAILIAVDGYRAFLRYREDEDRTERVPAPEPAR